MEKKRKSKRKEKKTMEKKNHNQVAPADSQRGGKDRKGSKKYFLMLAGNTLNYHEDILKDLHKKRTLKKVPTVEECDVIMVFCPIVSRAGTDIESALQKINDASETKPAILIVLHHTFDPDCIVADCSWEVKKEQIFAVDVLFHEDRGVFRCPKNKISLKKVSKQLKSANLRKIKKKTSKKRSTGCFG